MTALPFPEEKQRAGQGSSWGGPGYHLAVLRESQDFWEDRDEEIVAAAEQELEDDLDALAAALAGRWGHPQTVDLSPYLGLDHHIPDFVATEPLAFMSGLAGSMQVWQLPQSSRWLALTIGQADPEFPLQLLAAVGTESLIFR
ncbi:hypothetical protein [Streptomyces sp. RKAG290]|uniref:hypothetical protein n=1 Tax=Streptomyces sp. RKAG290 TaxID=2888348 RepID=UPI002034094E|nr:hypothetical protein [Streptomyces sp. RKAG290]MCM2416095.1 hypothetical protein [Streptomyces sp. RKAG290]